MKLPPSKAEIREQLEQQMRDFLANGGAVNNVPRGTSGRENNSPIPTQGGFAFNGNGAARAQSSVPLHDVVKSIEARKRAKPAKTSAKKPAPRPRRKMIYDDFGEPLRWEWVAE